MIGGKMSKKERTPIDNMLLNLAHDHTNGLSLIKANLKLAEHYKDQNMFKEMEEAIKRAYKGILQCKQAVDIHYTALKAYQEKI